MFKKSSMPSLRLTVSSARLSVMALFFAALQSVVVSSLILVGFVAAGHSLSTIPMPQVAGYPVCVFLGGFGLFLLWMANLNVARIFRNRHEKDCLAVGDFIRSVAVTDDVILLEYLKSGSKNSIQYKIVNEAFLASKLADPHYAEAVEPAEKRKARDDFARSAALKSADDNQVLIEQAEEVQSSK